MNTPKTVTRLTLDYLLRWWWVAVLFAAYAVLHAVHSGTLIFLLVYPAMAGGVLYSYELEKGVHRTLNTLPCSMRTHTRLRWFLGALFWPGLALCVYGACTAGQVAFTGAEWRVPVDLLALTGLSSATLLVMVLTMLPRQSRATLARRIGAGSGLVFLCFLIGWQVHRDSLQDLSLDSALTLLLILLLIGLSAFTAPRLMRNNISTYQKRIRL
jgi:hypothetical protein